MAKPSKPKVSIYVTPELLIAMAALASGDILVDTSGLPPRMYCSTCYGYGIVDIQDITPVHPSSPVDVIEDSVPCPMCADNAGFGLEIPNLLQATGYGECVRRGDPAHWIITDAGRAMLAADK